MFTACPYAIRSGGTLWATPSDDINAKGLKMGYSVKVGNKWLCYDINENFKTESFEMRWIFDLEGQALIAAKKAREAGFKQVTVYGFKVIVG